MTTRTAVLQSQITKLTALRDNEEKSNNRSQRYIDDLNLSIEYYQRRLVYEQNEPAIVEEYQMIEGVE